VATLTWTAEAVRWLEEIHGYVARDNPEAALRTVSGVYDRAALDAVWGSVTILGVFHDALPIDRYLR
jgi:hypothetical protein